MYIINYLWTESEVLSGHVKPKVNTKGHTLKVNRNTEVAELLIHTCVHKLYLNSNYQSSSMKLILSKKKNS